MIPVNIEFDIVDDAGCEQTMLKDVYLHCLPRLGDHVQVHEGLDASKVRRVLFCADGTICIELEDIKSFDVPTLRDNLESIGFFAP